MKTIIKFKYFKIFHFDNIIDTGLFLSYFKYKTFQALLIFTFSLIFFFTFNHAFVIFYLPGGYQ